MLKNNKRTYLNFIFIKSLDSMPDVKIYQKLCIYAFNLFLFSALGGLWISIYGITFKNPIILAFDCLFYFFMFLMIVTSIVFFMNDCKYKIFKNKALTILILSGFYLLEIGNILNAIFAYHIELFDDYNYKIVGIPYYFWVILVPFWLLYFLFCDLTFWKDLRVKMNYYNNEYFYVFTRKLN